MNRSGRRIDVFQWCVFGNAGPLPSCETAPSTQPRRFTGANWSSGARLLEKTATVFAQRASIRREPTWGWRIRRRVARSRRQHCAIVGSASRGLKGIHLRTTRSTSVFTWRLGLRDREFPGFSWGTSRSGGAELAFGALPPRPRWPVFLSSPAAPDGARGGASPVRPVTRRPAEEARSEAPPGSVPAPLN